MGVHTSTISRELRRNIALRCITAGDYVASKSQRKSDIRHQQKPKKVLFTIEMKRHAIKQLMIDKWSPELVIVKGKESG